MYKIFRFRHKVNHRGVYAVNQNQPNNLCNHSDRNAMVIQMRIIPFILIATAFNRNNSDRTTMAIRMRIIPLIYTVFAQLLLIAKNSVQVHTARPRD